MRIFVGMVLCAMIAIPLTGCSGCGEDPAEKTQAEKDAEKKKKKSARKEKKPKPNVEEFDRLRVQPHATYRTPREKQDRIKLKSTPTFAKPGHWVGVSHHVRANNLDFRGQLVWQPQYADEATGALRPLPLERASYQMLASRPVMLAKDQRSEKKIDTTLFVPRHGSETKFRYEYQRGGGGSAGMPVANVRHMPAHQYNLVVLSAQPDPYRALHATRTVRPRNNETRADAHYLVVPMKVDRRTPLPMNSLAWTSIAYLLWDEVDPSLLLEEQQQAMIDWLHWGGQIVVSGPDSLESLRGSFLEPFLPVQGGDSLQLDEQQLVELQVTMPRAKRGQKAQPLRVATPWVGIELKLPKESDSYEGSTPNILLSTPSLKPLVVEQRVGRGRVVVTAFRLRQRELMQRWSGFDNFLNAYLLRRKARVFRDRSEVPTPENQRDDLLLDDAMELVDWQGMYDRRYDPQLVTNYRLFGRDAGYVYETQPKHDYDVSYPLTRSGDYAELRPEPGIGGWSDDNAIAETVRESMTVAAGIEIPAASFVLQVLFGYLIVLVPLNWGLFRLIGRVEWAWFAAPIISIGGALLVIHFAQLDIGFVRSRTELAVVELQPDYPRAHVTRYTALYTSLSTGYDLGYDDAGALVQPFSMQASNYSPRIIDPDAYRYTGSDTVHYRSNEKVGMSGFHVISNSTGVLHSEQMVDLGGSIALTHDAGGRIEVTNGTSMPLAAAFVVRRRVGETDDSKRFQIASLGSLEPGANVPATLKSIKGKSWLPEWTASVSQEDLSSRGGEIAWEWLFRKQEPRAMPSTDEASQVNQDEYPLTKLVHGRQPAFTNDGRSARQRMLSFDDLKPGDTRLVAVVTDQQLPGMRIDPVVNQSRNVTLVVANLKFASGQKPRHDESLPTPHRRPALPFMDDWGESADEEDFDSTSVGPFGIE